MDFVALMGLEQEGEEGRSDSSGKAEGWGWGRACSEGWVGSARVAWLADRDKLWEERGCWELLKREGGVVEDGDYRKEGFLD